MIDRIYISYAWKGQKENVKGSREEIVNNLCKVFKDKGYEIIRDKTHMNYRYIIREFMNDISNAAILITIISKKYLHSSYCMYELTATWDKGKFENRVFPIILPDATYIYDTVKQIELVKFWEKEYKKYKSSVSSIEDSAKDGFIQKLRDLEFIHQRVSGSIYSLTGMVGIDANLLLESQFSEIINQVEQQITPAKLTQSRVESKNRKGFPFSEKNKQFLSKKILIILTIVFILILSLFFFSRNQTVKIEGNNNDNNKIILGNEND